MQKRYPLVVIDNLQHFYMCLLNFKSSYISQIFFGLIFVQHREFMIKMSNDYYYLIDVHSFITDIRYLLTAI